MYKKLTFLGLASLLTLSGCFGSTSSLQAKDVRVSFMDESGTTCIYEDTIKEGEDAVFKGDYPVKGNDESISYRFDQ